MRVRGIHQALLDLLLELGRDNHPREFAGVLREEDGVITEFSLLPGTVTGGESASLFLDMMPLDTHLAGSAHSHPNGVLSPSQADISFFPRAGTYHLIIGYPYKSDCWRSYRADGSPVALEVVE
ncbi:MAG: Mov34/MPN/PAD-1 family protein [Methanolinea sp.]|nr:Mov34/MPN/PAD-1 family protein [Methanolinea sp.]